MTTDTKDRAEVFSRPAAQLDGDGNIEVRASSALGLPPRPPVLRHGLRADEPPQRGVTDGDGGGQRP